ncbi:DdrB-like ParB superfamily domain [Pseudoalteromonas phage vB_Pun_Y3]
MAKDYFANEPLPKLFVPAAATAPPAPESQQGRIGDTVDAAQAGLLSAVGGIFDFVGAEGIAQSLYGRSDDQYTQMSDRGREALNKQFIGEDEEGNLTIGEGATDLDTWILTMANVAGQFAGTAIPGAGWASGAAKVASLGAKGKRVANIAGMGATGGSAATGQGMEQARKEIENMPDAILADSPLFGDLYRSVHQSNPDQSTEDKWKAAKKALANKVAQEVRTDPKVLLANFGASAVGDPVIGRALTGSRLAQSAALRTAVAAGSRVPKGGVARSAGVGLATEGTTESVQAGVQQLGINEALQPIDNRDSMQKVLSTALNEGIAGAGFGGMAGGIGGLVNRKPAEPTTETGLLGLPPPSDLTVADAINSMDAHAERTRRDVENLDIPTAARNAGFDTPAGAGKFGDTLNQNFMSDSTTLSELYNQSIADMIADAQTHLPERFVHEGDWLGPEGQGQQSGSNAQLDNAVFEGELSPEQALLPTSWETRRRQDKERAQSEFNAQPAQLENKNIIFGEDGRPQQQAAQRVKQAGIDSQNLLPQKDIIFADDQSGVNVARNGKPYKSEKEARNNKLARKAKREGAEIEVVPFDNGYGWTIASGNTERSPVMDNGANQEVTNSQSLYDDPNSPPIRLSMTEQEYLAKVDSAGNPKGKKAKVYTPSGTVIEAEYTIIDAFGGDIQASNTPYGEVNPNYPKELQPRDRSRAASIAQINKIAKGVIPDRLGASLETDRGAPIIKDNIVESGNGRVLALTEAYRTGRGEEYRQYLIDNSETFGIDRELLEHIDTPILVRKRLTEMTPQERVAFTVDSNRSAGIEQAPTEIAQSDARLISDDDLKLLSVSDDGNILGRDNQSFLYQFAKRLGDNESAKYRQSNGEWNSQFATRVNNAIFAKSYNDSDLLTNISESTSQESKNVMTALMRASGKVSELKGLDSDAGNALSETISKAAQAIIKSRRDNTTVAESLSQVDMLSGQTQPEVEKLALLLESNIRSANKMTAALDSIADQLLVAAQNSGQVDIFTGEVAPQPSINEALNYANQDKENSGSSVRTGAQSQPQQPGPTQSVEPDNQPSQESIRSSRVELEQQPEPQPDATTYPTVDDVSEAHVKLSGKRAASGQGAVPRQAADVAWNIRTDMLMGESYQDALAKQEARDSFGTMVFKDVLEQLRPDTDESAAQPNGPEMAQQTRDSISAPRDGKSAPITETETQSNNPEIPDSSTNPKKRKVYGWDRVELSKNYTANELDEWIKELGSDPDNQIKDGIYQLDAKTRKKIDQLTWAVYYIQKEQKNEQEQLGRDEKTDRKITSATYEGAKKRKEKEVENKSKFTTMEDAKNQGFDVDNIYYHGTGIAFNSFDDELLGKEWQRFDYGVGHYITPSLKEAEKYASFYGKSKDFTPEEKSGVVMPVIIRLKKPLVIDINKSNFSDAFWNEIPKDITKKPEATTWLRSQGYDGVIVHRGKEVDQISVFSQDDLMVLPENYLPKQTESTSQAPVKQTPIESGLDAYDSMTDAMSKGEVDSVQEVKRVLDYLASNEESVKAELNKLNKKQLTRLVSGHVWGDTKKAELVNSAYRDMFTRFRFIGEQSEFISTNSYKLEDKISEAKDHVDSLTDQQVAEYSQAQKAKSDAQKERFAQYLDQLKNPQTLEDYQAKIKTQGQDSLTAEQQAEYDKLIAKDTIESQSAQPTVKQGLNTDGDVELGEPVEGVHGKTGEKIFNVNVISRLGKDAFKEAAAFARSMGGGYYRSNFYFKSVEDAELFSGWVNGEVVDTTEMQAQKTEQRNAKNKDKLQALADRAQEQANEALNADRKTNTVKRLNESQAASERAEHELALAKITREIPDSDTIVLKGVTQKVQVELLDRLSRSLVHTAPDSQVDKDSNSKRTFKETVSSAEKAKYARMPLKTVKVFRLNEIANDMLEVKGFVLLGRKLKSIAKGKSDQDYVDILDSVMPKYIDYINKHTSQYDMLRDEVANYKRLERMGVSNEPTLRTALVEYMDLRDQTAASRPAKSKLSQMEQDLQRTVLSNRNAFNDFFPTPETIATDIADMADIEQGMRVLEPSAGNGLLADAARAQGASVDVVEMGGQLRDILQEKGYNLIGSDFLEVEASQEYDRIIMNPPFSKDQDIKHVEHAYKMLKPGGKLVAITSSSAGDRANKTNKAFKDWLDSLDAEQQPLPEGAFKSSLNPTGVSTKVIVIEKPAGPAGQATSSDENTGNIDNEITQLGNELKDSLSSYTKRSALESRVLSLVDKVKDANGNWYLVQKKLFEGEYESDIDAAIAEAKSALSKPTKSESTKPKNQEGPQEIINDFGEKLGGARKDAWSGFSEAIAEQRNTAELPLSKSWPEPNYKELAEKGVSAESMALMAAMRSEIPPKPRVARKVARWAEKVNTLKSIASSLVSGELDAKGVMQRMRDQETNLSSAINLPAIANAVPAIAKADIDTLKTVSDYRINSGSFSVFGGKQYKPSKTFYFIERNSKPVYEGASENLSDVQALLTKQVQAEQPSTGAGNGAKQSKISVYIDRYTKQSYLGWKGASGILKIKEFKNTTDARKYLNENRAEVEQTLQRMKDTPKMRKPVNEERSGPERYSGEVTPEIFADEFGFRGVEFGNWVEQSKRQKDLNQAYDGLMDLAEALDIQPKALSLNGQLGLAFGARGKGGKEPAAAHYESDKVVINLTKKAGAGSLAHEWWHALDNYFGKQKSRGEFITDMPFSMPTDQIRSVMADAFKHVRNAVIQSGLPERSRELDTRRSKAYWATNVEMTARSFETYIIDKLSQQGVSNDYLANVVSDEAWSAAEALGLESSNTYPYPNKAEQEQINSAYQSLFDTMESENTSEGIRLFSRSKASKKAKGVSAEQAQEIANDFIKGLNGAKGITVNVLQSNSDAERLWRMSLDGATVKGAYSNNTKTVYIIADNISSIEDLNQTLAHETIAHGGLDTVISKDDYKAFIERIKATRNKKAFKKFWQNADKDYAGFEEGIKAEEIFARFVEEQPTKGELKFWWNALVKFITKTINKVGIKYNADINAMNEMLDSIVKGFKAQGGIEAQQAGNLADSQTGNKLSRVSRLSEFQAEIQKAVYGNDRSIIKADGSVDYFEYLDRAMETNEKIEEQIYSGEVKNSNPDLFEIFGWDPSSIVPLTDSDANKVIKKINSKVLYHGSPATDLDRLDVGEDSALYLAHNEREANEYTGHDGRIYKVRVNLKNPLFVIDSDVTMDLSGDEYFGEMRRRGYDSIVALDNGELVILDESALNNSNETDKTAGDKIKRQLSRWFMPGGNLPESVQQAKRGRDRDVAVHEFDVSMLVGKLDSAMKAAKINPDKLTDDQWAKYHQYLTGENNGATLNQSERDVLLAMRGHIDGLTRDYVASVNNKLQQRLESEGIEDPNEIARLEKMLGNIGKYLNRSYKAFDDEKWFSKIPTNVGGWFG